MLPRAQKHAVAEDEQRRGTLDPRKVLTGRGAGQSRVTLAPGQIVYAQGAAAEAAYYIKSGWVNISSVVPSGKEAVVSIRREGDFFGIRSLITKLRTASATTLTDCSLVRVTRSALIRILREEPGFGEMFTIYLLRQSLRDQSNLVDHLTNPAEKRLARTLLRLADGVDGDDHPHPISAPLHQAVLASMIGTTRPRVSFFMNKFKRRGFIEYDREGHLVVRRAGLRRLLQQ